MTQTQVAVTSGIHYTRISQIELGLGVSHRDALALAKAMGREVKDLFDASAEEATTSADR